ncbi:MAG: acyl carrier protein [Clostridiales bacterium]|nr:acyl carrier protein [Clostridiales bacterium]
MTSEKLIELIAKQFKKDPSTINEDTRIIEDLEADSLDIVEMLMTLEEDYGISIPDDEVQEIKTVGDVKKYI